MKRLQQSLAGKPSLLGKARTYLPLPPSKLSSKVLRCLQAHTCTHSLDLSLYLLTSGFKGALQQFLFWPLTFSKASLACRQTEKKGDNSLSQKQFFQKYNQNREALQGMSKNGYTIGYRIREEEEENPPKLLKQTLGRILKSFSHCSTTLLVGFFPQPGHLGSVLFSSFSQTLKKWII